MARFYLSHKNIVIIIIVYELCGFCSVVAEYTQVFFRLVTLCHWVRGF